MKPEAAWTSGGHRATCLSPDAMTRRRARLSVVAAEGGRRRRVYGSRNTPEMPGAS